MSESPEKPVGDDRVANRVQVCLEASDSERLERLARRLGITKSEVLGRGLAALASLEDKTNSVPLPTFMGKGLQPGVNLDSSRALLRLMEEGRAT